MVHMVRYPLGEAGSLHRHHHSLPTWCDHASSCSHRLHIETYLSIYLSTYLPGQQLRLYIRNSLQKRYRRYSSAPKQPESLLEPPLRRNSFENASVCGPASGWARISIWFRVTFMLWIRQPKYWTKDKLLLEGRNLLFRCIRTNEWIEILLHRKASYQVSDHSYFNGSYPRYLRMPKPFPPIAQKRMLLTGWRCRPTRNQRTVLILHISNPSQFRHFNIK